MDEGKGKEQSYFGDICGQEYIGGGECGHEHLNAYAMGQ